MTTNPYEARNLEEAIHDLETEERRLARDIRDEEDSETIEWRKEKVRKAKELMLRYKSIMTS